MKKIVVLGAGMVGSAIAIDLASEYEVTSVDTDPSRLSYVKERAAVAVQQVDLSNAKAVKDSISGQDLVIGAVPGFMGFETLRIAIEAGKNVVDISFLPEDHAKLHDDARQAGVTVAVDCGVAPGLCNMVLGYHCEEGPVSSYRCLVGGLPFRRSWPFQYKAPFSPIDVIEEYTRPARLVKDGNIVVRPALSDVEQVEVPRVGTLEAFNTDGLRSLLYTVKVPDMVEKTLRYPGHIDYMRMLRESGFFSKSPIQVAGQAVVPLDVTAALLFPQWQLEVGEREFTAMQVEVVTAGENPQKHTYDLFDEFDAETGTSSMARTTGYTCTSVARALLSGKISSKGVLAPEELPKEPGAYEAILADLKARRIVLHHQQTPVEA